MHKRPLITDMDAATRHQATRRNRRKLRQTLRSYVPRVNLRGWR